MTMSERSSHHVPGPHVVPIDYDALYAMDEPPGYEPFPIYGFFLASVAVQQTPMVVEPFGFTVPDRIEATQDIVYKEVDGSELGLDVFRPAGQASPNPLIVLIHGGYWRTGDKGERIQLAVELADLGYTVASMNYRTSGIAPFPAAIEDIRDAVLHLTEHADDYSVDSSQIVFYGGSAGGHLSAFMGLAANTPDRPYVAGLDASAIKGIITLYGMHDLTLPIQREHPFTEEFIGATWAEAPDTYVDASPVSHVDPDDPPLLVIHGALDGSVSVQNSDSLARHLDEAGVTYTYDRIEGWPHAMDFFSPIGERCLWHIHRFLSQHMPSSKLAAGT